MVSSESSSDEDDDESSESSSGDRSAERGNTKFMPKPKGKQFQGFDNRFPPPKAPV
jgi:hypothetical protein